GRAMYIWRLRKALGGGNVGDMVARAKAAKLTSLWVKIGDGTKKFENITGEGARQLRELVAECAAANISVLGYHVPWCRNLASANDEAAFVANTIGDFKLAGAVVDNEDGANYFKGDKQTAEAYGTALQTPLRAAGKLVVMSSNDFPSVHKKAYAEVIG